MSDEWNRPKAPPPPLFLGKKERDLVKQVNDELIEKVASSANEILEVPVKTLIFAPPVVMFPSLSIFITSVPLISKRNSPPLAAISFIPVPSPRI